MTKRQAWSGIAITATITVAILFTWRSDAQTQAVMVLLCVVGAVLFTMITRDG